MRVRRVCPSADSCYKILESYLTILFSPGLAVTVLPQLTGNIGLDNDKTTRASARVLLL